MSVDCQSFKARWLFPVNAEPVENATIQIEADQISAVHATHDPRAQDLGNVAIIPGLVNAHTHLEFSDLKKPIEPSSPFTDWLRAVVAQRRRDPASFASIDAGTREVGQSGTTIVGEISTAQPSENLFSQHGPIVVSLRELIGFLPEQIEPQYAIAQKHLAETRQNSRRPDVIHGISAHAPYSVHPELFLKLTRLAGEFDVPFAIHLAETKDELAFLANGTGPFVTFLQEFGVWRDAVVPRRSRPLDYLRRLQDLTSALVIHGNYLSDEEIDYVASHPNLTVVYCPRTHAYFGHSPHPWQELLERGASIAIGTDSRASNPDLSLFRELQYLAERFPHADPRVLLELGTINGARALDPGSQRGCLAPGRPADLVLVSLPQTDASEAYALLFHTQSRVRRTMRSGQWLT